MSCIAGLFAAIQCRGCLLIALCVTIFFSFSYNIFLILWYLMGDQNSTLLSVGLPYSYSFFLRHTPICGAHFNLTLSQWQQNSNCLFPYYNVESLQVKKIN